MKKLNITLLKARNALFITAFAFLALFSSPAWAQVFLTDGDSDGFTPLEGDCDDSDNLIFPGAGGCRDADALDATALDTSYSTDGVDFFSIPASLDIYSVISPDPDQFFFSGESNGEPLLFKISGTLSPTSGSYYNTSDIFTDTSAPANSRYLSSLSAFLSQDYACYGTTGSEAYGVVALDPSVPEHISSFGSSGIATQSLALGLFTENCILLSDGTDLFVFASGCTGDESTCTTDVTKRDSFTGSIEGSFASSGTYAGLNNKKLIHAVNSFSGSEFFQLYADATTDALSLIDSTGVLVTSFGTDGYADLPVALESGQILVSDDEIYIAGTSGDNSTIHVFKMDDTGTLDATFGTAGQLDIVISSEVTEPLSILNVLSYSYTLDNVDQFLIGGSLGDDAFIATLDTVNATLYSGHGGSGDGLFILNLGANEFSSSVIIANGSPALIGVSNQSGTSEVYAAKYELSICGDGIIDPLEEGCDDGNTIAHDGCADTCAIEVLKYIDADHDGFGDPLSTLQLIDPSLIGYSTDNTDCDDTSNLAYPTATEACDGIDNDCDSTVDESGATGETTFYQDSDGDTFGDADSTQLACSAPTGFVADDTDCDDAESVINPDATEECDEVDNDCDGSTDEAGAEGEETFYEDSDADTFGNPDSSRSACEMPSGYVSNDSDCNDESSDIHSSADEICGDGIDQDCDGEDLTCDPVDDPTTPTSGCQMSQENQNPQSFAFSVLLLIGGLTLVRRRLTA